MKFLNGAAIASLLASVARGQGAADPAPGPNSRPTA